MSKKNGLSIWLDFVERGFLKNEFVPLLERGVVKGATSNPSIFSAAITTSDAYSDQLDSLDGKSAKERYEALAIVDIKMAAQALRSSYENGEDGYISIEVDPFFSSSSADTIAEGKRLFDTIGEQNVMIKIPATKAGYPAMRELMSLGISVNATLVFSPEQATKSLQALAEGTEIFQKNGDTRVDGVISVFVSRFDRMLDEKLKEKGIEVSKTGILNAAKIYNIIEQSSLPNIRTLFASTGVKGDNLPADYYIRELMAPHAVNTAPLATIEAYLQNKAEAVMSLPINESVINDYFNILEINGVDINEVYDKLMRDGLKQFEDSFDEMLKNI